MRRSSRENQSISKKTLNEGGKDSDRDRQDRRYNESSLKIILLYGFHVHIGVCHGTCPFCPYDASYASRQFQENLMSCSYLSTIMFVHVLCIVGMQMLMNKLSVNMHMFMN